MVGGVKGSVMKLTSDFMPSIGPPPPGTNSTTPYQNVFVIALCAPIFEEELKSNSSSFKSIQSHPKFIKMTQTNSEGKYQIPSTERRNDLPNLKCFSLMCCRSFQGFDNVIVRLLHRMIYLEELTLYLNIFGGSKFIAGTHLDNEILIHMPQLHTFIFYIASENVIDYPTIRVSNDDIQRTFTNLEHRQVACMVDYFEPYEMICRVFSLPFKFHLLESIGNNIPNIVFNSVTYLKLWDIDPFKYEFFVRLARAFPFLKNLSIRNIIPPFLDKNYHLRDKDWLSIIEYPHLISLDMERANSYYLENFLNETKTYSPHLTELKVTYYALEIVTNNFTRNETRRNCAEVRQLIAEGPMVYSKDVYCYFPLLSV
ncbi:unnamed protein product [Rotaria sp. Silwood1]|nr:unnamed protein product [Rotaria sp. Silwood1]